MYVLSMLDYNIKRKTIVLRLVLLIVLLIAPLYCPDDPAFYTVLGVLCCISCLKDALMLQIVEPLLEIIVGVVTLPRH